MNRKARILTHLYRDHSVKTPYYSDTMNMTSLKQTDTPEAQRILIVEDNRDLAELLRLHLQNQQYAVDVAYDGITGFNFASKAHYQLIILDVMLPGMDGVALCRKIRESNAMSSILMLTSRTAESDRVMGLEAGADDYVLKPFSVLELMARIKAQFRKIDVLEQQNGTVSTFTSIAQNDDEISHLGMVINLTKRRVMIDDKAIELTAREFDLLVHFAKHPGQVFSRKQLLDQVWGYAYDGYEHTVNSHINRLRVKIEENPASPEYIQTVWGVGYRYAE